MKHGFCTVKKKLSAIETDASGNCEDYYTVENCATILGASRGGRNRRSRTGRPSRFYFGRDYSTLFPHDYIIIIAKAHAREG